MRQGFGGRVSGHPRGVIAVLAGLLAFIACGVYATNYSLWINGRTGDGAPGNHADFTCGGPTGERTRTHPRCAGLLLHRRNWCYVAAHSAGNLQIGGERRPTPGARHTDGTTRPAGTSVGGCGDRRRGRTGQCG